MLYFLLPLAVTGTALALNDPLTSYADCTNEYVPITVTAQNVNFNLHQPTNQSVVTSFITNYFSTNSNTSAQIGTQTHAVTGTYKIFTRTCVPKNWHPSGNGTVEVAIHGINFDHSYWEFPYASEYNYVKAATQAGNAVFMYDRLGVGSSDHPDGIQVVQTATEIEIAHALIQHVKADSRFKASKLIGLGHSYGSIQLLGIATSYPNDLSSLILTGFSASTASVPLAFASFSSQIASQQNGPRFAKYANDQAYWATATSISDQFAFFTFPYYDPGAFSFAVQTKQTFTLGEVTTLALPAQKAASGFTGPILVVTGDKDLIFCGGDCYQPPKTTSGTSLLDDVKSAFPKASKFSTYIPPNTGHAVNIHYSAGETYKKINDWIVGVYA